MRVFLVPLVADDHDRVALAGAFALAAHMEGRVEGLFVRPDPIDTLSQLTEGASPEAIRSVTRAARETLDERHGAAAAALDAAAQPGVTARLLEATGDPATLVAAYGRTADLIVFPVATVNDRPRRSMFEAALFHSSRATLLVPAGGMAGPPERIAVAWNGTPEAARAVQAARPLLSAAREIHLIGIGNPRLEPAKLESLAAYLEVHGIASTSHRVSGDGGVGGALLRGAQEHAADLLVMGGYGRSRMQELIFGGATRHVIGHADLPVLLAH